MCSIGLVDAEQNLALAVERVEREQVGQRPRLRLGHRDFGGALKHAVPRVRVGVAGAPVEAAA